jgi:hypothetical protein
MCPCGVLAQTAAQDMVRVKEDVRDLHRQLNEAVLKRDRAALERMYAPSFLFVHAYHYVDTRDEHFDLLLNRSTAAPFPLPLPTFDAPNEILAFGDVVVWRNPKARTGSGGPGWGTTIMVRSEGRLQFVQIQGTEMQPERQWLSLDATSLERFAGRYRRSSGATTTITVKDGMLWTAMSSGPYPQRWLKPTGDTVFFDRFGWEWAFYRDANGRVSHFVQRARGTESRGDRID